MESRVFRMVAATVLGAWLTAGAVAAPMTIEQQEEFLRSAKIVKTKTLSEGVTRSLRGTLSNGEFTHDASIQQIDEFKQVFASSMGTELNFKDTYKANIAAYRLGRLLGLEEMTPVAVDRRVQGKSAAVTWWVDDVLMTEKDRFFKKTPPPDMDRWNRQMYIVRAFDQLIYNTDRNLGNLVIDKSWNLHMIDHTRAFRLHKKLLNEDNLVRCDRELFEAMKRLDRAALRGELKPFLTNGEIDAVLARRDKIVELFEKRAARNGDAAVFYDYLSLQGDGE